MVLRAGLEPARIAPHAPQTCAATNYATSAKWNGIPDIKHPAIHRFTKNYLLAGASEFAAGASALEFDSTGAAGSEFVLVSAGTTVSTSAGASGLLDSTETFPVSAGIEMNRADNIKATAAPMVIFDRTVAVPRGLKAVLETLLVKRAPASVLPGCSNTAAISTKQEIKKIPYKT